MKSISIGKLYKSLGYKNSKVPKNEEKEFNNIPLIDSEEIILFYSNVKIKKGLNRYHRVFVLCPQCRQWISVGRFHQHFETKKCLIEMGKNIIYNLKEGL